MNIEVSQSGFKRRDIFFTRRLYAFLAPRAYSAIIFGALFCNLVVKFYHSYQNKLVGEYFNWILADIAVLVGIEAVMSMVCFRWPRRWVIRTVTIFAAIVCSWSVMNAAWLIRTGTQILPSVLLPLFRAPLNSLAIIGINLIKMPVAMVVLLGPSAIALVFLFFVLARPLPPVYKHKSLVRKIVVSVIIAAASGFAHIMIDLYCVKPTASVDLYYNCQLRTVTNFVLVGFDRPDKIIHVDNIRRIPTFEQIQIAQLPGKEPANHNVVIVVLEGIQYRYTSLGDKNSKSTPFLAKLAQEGIEFTNARSSVTHTTKALFSLLTGRYPSAYQDLVEAVPTVKPYAGLATILKSNLGFRTGFFQSAKGNFECRPGLANNLGFEKFWTREDLNDPNAFLGYLACDEFSMIKPITEWIKSDDKSFLLTIMCSVSHDPYEVPEWFAEPTKELVERYQQTISYTDKFIEALDAEFSRLGLAEKTIFCVVGDHGEAFGEHGLHGHERIAFEENLRLPWVVRAPSLIEPGGRITEPVSSIDLTPTILALLGFETDMVDFDGLNVINQAPAQRRVYFSSWMRQGPAGYVSGSSKYIYDPMNKMLFFYDLSTDPFELNRLEVTEQQTEKVAGEILGWRKNTFFHLNQEKSGMSLE